MPGGPICCLLGACCPPGAQRAALIDEAVAVGVPLEHAEKMADHLAPLLRAAAQEMKARKPKK